MLKYKRGCRISKYFCWAAALLSAQNGIEISYGSDSILKTQFIHRHPFRHALFQTVLFLIIKIYVVFNEKRWLLVLPA